MDHPHEKNIFLLLILCTQLCWAQTDSLFSVGGQVVDQQTGESISGATIAIVGVKGVGTSTDFDGLFRLDSLKKGDVLQVSFTGYHLQKIPIKAPTEELIIRLKQNQQVLEEAVVVGYGIPHGTRPRAAVFRGLSYNDMRTEKYAGFTPNSFIPTKKEPLSTFGLDVDQASYTNVRRMIEQGRMIPADAIRTEEFVNYFDYSHPAPQGDKIVRISTHYADCPWNKGHLLLMVGLKAKEMNREQLPASNFVVLIDNSGSMYQENRLPLVISSLKMLVEQLEDKDRISIITYGGGSEILLQGAKGNDKQAIVKILEKLRLTDRPPGKRDWKQRTRSPKKTTFRERQQSGRHRI